VANYDDDDSPRSSGPTATGIVAMVLPFATAIAALVVGAVLGFAIGLVVKPAEVVEKQVPRELTAAELASACAPTVGETIDKLEKAEVRVKSLEQEVSDRNARVAELEANQKKPGGGGVSKELAQARKDLEEARAQLAVAQQEKAQLVVELTQTKEQLAKTEQALVEQKELTHDAREDALVNKYFRFVNDAQLEICEKGSRKKMGNCRADVQAALQTNTKRRDKFAHCVRSGQATPTVRELEKGQTLPDYTEWVNEEEKTTRGYYILFCDPTLPEKADGDLAEQHLPTGN
jgi:hypothetical protein